MAEIKIPPLGESISEATVALITKKVGDHVKVDELLLELETDKVTLEINAPCSGVIESLTIKNGDSVVVNQIIGIVKEGAFGTTQSNLQDKPQGIGLAPSVERLTKENNINPRDLHGTGRDGRIVKGDVISYLENDKHHDKQPSIGSTDRKDEIIKITRLRQTIAKRLKDSQNTAAILTTFNEVDMTTVINLRSKYQDLFQKKHGIKIGFMSFFIKACISALTEIPAVNAEVRENTIVYRNYCDIGVAVGTENGLVVPVIKDAHKMSLFELEKAVYDFGVKARDGKITIDDMHGGTFTISNGGVYGSLLSTPIINPPQSGILGMHSIQKRPVVIDDKIEIRPMMYIALSYDHRVVDGREAVTFLLRVKNLLEDPARIVLGL